MKFVLKHLFVLSAAVTGAFKLVSPCDANIVEEKTSELWKDTSKVTKLRGVARGSQATKMATATASNSHDDMPARKLQTVMANISNAVPRTGLFSIVNASHTYFALRNVPIGEIVTCTTSGGTGNVDLYVRIGTMTQIEQYPDCSSKGLGNNEACSVGPMAARSDIFIDLYGGRTYTNVTLACYFPSPVTELQNTVSLTGQAGDLYSHLYFVLPKVPVESMVTCTTTGGTGNVDLYVKTGTLTGIEPYPNCVSKRSDNNESCALGPMAASRDVYVDLFGSGAYTVNTLICYAVRDLQTSVARTNLSGDRGSHTTFAVRNLPLGARVNCTASGGTGDVDLYVKIGGLANIKQSPNCKSEHTGNVESCVVGLNMTRADVFVDLYGYSAYTNVTLMCFLPTSSPTRRPTPPPTQRPTPPPTRRPTKSPTRRPTKPTSRPSYNLAKYGLSL